MALNLKNTQALEALEALASITGEGKSQAVTTALEERLARLLTDQGHVVTAEDRLARVRTIAADCAPRFAATATGAQGAAGEYPDLAAQLYDDEGLPA